MRVSQAITSIRDSIRKLNSKAYSKMVIGEPNKQNERKKNNAIAKDILNQLSADDREPTAQEIEALKLFTGSGGLGLGSIDEYYTPEYLAKSSVELLGVSDGDSVLDPTAGTGVFARSMPDSIKKINIEYSSLSAKIAGLTSDAQTINAPFEKASIDIPDNSVDGVVTNVPFGKRDMSLDTSPKYKGITTLEHYIVLKSLEKLKAGKRAVFIVPSSFLSNTNKYVKAKRRILEIASFVGGIKLPNKVFSATGANVCTDIVVFEKHPANIVEGIKSNIFSKESLESTVFGDLQAESFIKGTFFLRNVDNVIGKFIPSSEFEQSELFNGFDRKDQCLTTDSMSEIKEKIARLTKSKFKNTINYDLLEVSDKELAVTDETVERINLLMEEFHSAQQDIKQSSSVTDKQARELYRLFKEISALQTNSIVTATTELSYMVLGAYAKLSDDMVATAIGDDGIRVINAIKLISQNGTRSISDQGVEKLFASHNQAITRIADRAFTSTLRVPKSVFNAKIYNNNIAPAFQQLINNIPMVWDVGMVKPSSHSVAVETYQSTLVSKGIDIEMLEDNGNGILVFDNADGAFTAEEVLSNDSIILVDGKLAGIDEILYNGASVSDIKAYITTLEYHSSYGLSEDEFKRKKEAIKSLLGFYIKEVDISSIRITQESVASLLPERAAQRIISIKRSANASLMNGVYFINTTKNSEIDSADHVVANKTLVASFFSNGNYRIALDFFDKYSLDIAKAFGVSSIDSVISRYKRRDFSKDEKIEFFSKVVPILHKHNSREIAKYNLEIEARVKSDPVLSKLLVEQEAKNARVSIEASTGTGRIDGLSSVVNKEILDSNHGYQNADINSISSGMSGIIAADVGLGKTRIILLAAINVVMKRKAQRSLVVVPTALIDNWKLQATVGEKNANGEWIVQPIVQESKADTIAYITSKDKAEWNKLKTDSKVKVVIITADAFKTLQFTEDTLNMLQGSIQKEIDAGEQIVKPMIPHFNASDWNKAKAVKNSIGFFEESKIGFMIIDEAQEAKNAVTGGKSFKFASSLKGSVYGNRVAIVSTLLRLKNGGSKGCVFATATPFTSSPYEVFTMLKNAGGLGMVSDLGEFEKIFFKTRETFVSGVIDDSTMVKVNMFEGFNNLDLLKRNGMTGFKYRSVDTEGMPNLEPDALTTSVTVSSSDEIDGKKIELIERYTDLKDLVKMIDEGDGFDFDGMKSAILDKHGIDIGTTEGMSKARKKSSTFGMLDSLSKLTINKDFSEDMMVFNLNGYSLDDVNAFMGELFKKDVKSIEVQSVQDAKDASFSEKEVAVKVSLKSLDDKESLLVDGILTIPVIDESIASFIFKYFSGKESTVPLLSIDDFPKYKLLIENIKGELDKRNNAKQIIFSLSLAGAKYIEYFTSAMYEELGIKPLIMNSVDVPKKATDEGEAGEKSKFQQKYNNENSKPVVLVFTKSFSKGVNLNINTSAVHIVDVPYSPDVIHQAIGRGKRQGNKLKEISVYKYIQGGTVDTFKSLIVEEKASWQSSIVKGASSNTINTLSIDGEKIIAKAIDKFGAGFTDENLLEIKGQEEAKIQSIIDEEEALKNDSLMSNAIRKISKIGVDRLDTIERIRTELPSSIRDSTLINSRYSATNKRAYELLSGEMYQAFSSSIKRIALLALMTANNDILDDAGFRLKALKKVIFIGSDRAVDDSDDAITNDELTDKALGLVGDIMEDLKADLYEYENAEEVSGAVVDSVISSSTNEADVELLKRYKDGNAVLVRGKLMDIDDVAKRYDYKFFEIGGLFVSSYGDIRKELDVSGLIYEHIDKRDNRYIDASKAYSKHIAKKAATIDKYFDGKDIAIENYNHSITDIKELGSVANSLMMPELIITGMADIDVDFPFKFFNSPSKFVMNINGVVVHNIFNTSELADLEYRVNGAVRFDKPLFQSTATGSSKGVITNESDISVLKVSPEAYKIASEAIEKGFEFEHEGLVVNGMALEFPLGKADDYLEALAVADNEAAKGAFSDASLQDLVKMFVAMHPELKVEFVNSVFSGEVGALVDYAKLVSDGERLGFLEVPSWIDDDISFYLDDDLNLVVIGAKFNRDALPRGGSWGAYGIRFNKDSIVNVTGVSGAETVKGAKWTILASKSEELREFLK